jgi:hypothetical protein
MDVPHTTHLIWAGKSWVQGSFWGLAQTIVVFASLHIVRRITKTLHVGPTGRYTRSQNHNSALLRSLSNSKRRHKRNVLLLRNDAWYSLPVARARNVLNQYPNCKFKISTMPTHKIQVTQIKSPKFTSNSKILNTNQMSVSLFPCITLV